MVGFAYQIPPDALVTTTDETITLQGNPPGTYVVAVAGARDWLGSLSFWLDSREDIYTDMGAND